MEQEVATQVVGLGGSTDFSLIQLFVRADFVVKSVIIILIAASIFSWALIFEKYRLFKRIEKSTSNFEEKFWKSRSAESFYNSYTNRDKDPMANVFHSAMGELIKTNKDASTTKVIEIYPEISSKLSRKKDSNKADAILIARYFNDTQL